MSIFIQFEGIDGDATDDKHKKWIAANSVQFGFGRAIGTAQGATAHRETSAPSVSEIVFTKELDAASPKLFTSSLNEVEGKKVKIDMCRTGGPSGLIVYSTYILDNVLISGYSVSSGGDRPTESISLNFSKIEFDYTPFDDKNKAGTTVRVNYDMTTTKTG